MIGDSWLKTTVGEQATLQRGIDITKAEQRPGKVPVISSGGISSYHDISMVTGPGVVLGRKGVVGSVFFVNEDYWPHDTSLWVKDFHGNYPRFVYYFFRSIAPQIARMDVGSANPTLNRNHVHPIPVVWPPLAEQKAIAAVLGALDDKIELNRRTNATLEAMARALFQSWFVDFDPVRAKLNGDQPSGLDPATAALFPEHLVDSPLGHIPRGWRVCKLNALVDYLSRGIGPSYTDEGGVCVLNQKCVRNHQVDFTKSRRHDSIKKPIGNRSLQLHDVLVNSTGMGTLGRVAQLFQLPETTLVDSHISVVRANTETNPFFLGVNLTGREDEIEELGEGSTGQTELSRVRLGELKVITPPVALQQAFGTCVHPLFLCISENEAQSCTLTLLRDTLLPKLLSGELRAPSREEAVP